MSSHKLTVGPSWNVPASWLKVSPLKRMLIAESFDVGWWVCSHCHQRPVTNRFFSQCEMGIRFKACSTDNIANMWNIDYSLYTVYIYIYTIKCALMINLPVHKGFHRDSSDSRRKPVEKMTDSVMMKTAAEMNSIEMIRQKSSTHGIQTHEQTPS